MEWCRWAGPLCFLLACGLSEALDNGAADTPPLGWCSWQRWRCTRQCASADAPDCFNEGLIKRIADAMAASPLKEAGYAYVALDDCWQAPERVDGRVVPDPHRFPSGMKALADYVHGKGLKFGLYTAVGNGTCAMRGTLGLGCDYEQIPSCPVAKRDIEQLVGWGIDHLKVDGCFEFDQPHMNASYAIVGNFLQDAVARRGGGPVVYHPSNLAFEFPRQLRELASIANQWRFQTDVQDSWESVAGIIAAIGAGMPECVPGPLPVNCTGRLRGRMRRRHRPPNRGSPVLRAVSRSNRRCSEARRDIDSSTASGAARVPASAAGGVGINVRYTQFGSLGS